MSVLFYRRPDYLQKANGPINSSDCAKYVERAKNSERAIPDGLSFEDVINNRPLPPCSLSDFMDYLVYVEFNAENLQFYLWYKDYEKRFNALSAAQKALSPVWVPEMPNLAKDPEKECRYVKREKATEAEIEAKKTVVFKDELERRPNTGHCPSASRGTANLPAYSSTSDLGVVPTVADVTAQAGLNWQPFTIQPMREEINGVMRHYIAFGAPRELNLSHKTRTQCLHALQHTTHPSALAPAVKIAEATIRGQSHPNFIRWSICNGNKPRVFFVRSLGVFGFFCGFIIAIFLTFSDVNRWYRTFAAIPTLIGISTLVASYKGLCIIMHHSHGRNLRPWEQYPGDEELGNDSLSSFSMSSRTITLFDADRKRNNNTKKPSREKLTWHTFGPKIGEEAANCLRKWDRKPWLRKVFEKTTWTQDETLRMLQDKIVLGAHLWGILITVPLTAFVIALPTGKMLPR